MCHNHAIPSNQTPYDAHVYAAICVIDQGLLNKDDEGTLHFLQDGLVSASRLNEKLKKLQSLLAEHPSGVLSEVARNACETALSFPTTQS